MIFSYYLVENLVILIKMHLVILIKMHFFTSFFPIFYVLNLLFFMCFFKRFFLGIFFGWVFRFPTLVTDSPCTRKGMLKYSTLTVLQRALISGAAPDVQSTYELGRQVTQPTRHVSITKLPSTLWISTLVTEAWLRMQESNPFRSLTPCICNDSSSIAGTRVSKSVTSTAALQRRRRISCLMFVNHTC